MSPSQPPTRFLIISDTHNFEFSNASPSSPLNHPLPHADVLLHCGDLTHTGGLPSYKKALNMLSTINAELKLVIAGNHDLDLDPEFWKTHPQDGYKAEDHSLALKTMTGPLAAEAGITYLTEGTYTFTLKSGVRFTIYASPYTPEFCDWAFATAHGEDRYNTASQALQHAKPIAQHPIPADVDIIMTHGPPQGHFDTAFTGQDVGCPHLLQAVKRVKPLLHCFGHIHEQNGGKVVDWRSKNVSEWDFVDGNEGPVVNRWPRAVRPRVKSGEQTMMVNAAVMDGENRPVQKPWLIDLELERG